MASVGATKGTVRLQCSAHRESGACGNGRKVSRDMVEATVFACLAEELIHHAAIAEYVKTYNAERRRLAKGNGERMAKLSRREAEIGRELERAIDTVTKGADIRAMVPRINALQAERDQVAAQLAQAAGSADVVTLHPASIERYAADIARPAELTASQAEFSVSAELTATLRRLVQSVIVHAEPSAQGFSVEIKGRLAELSGASAATFQRRSERW